MIKNKKLIRWKVDQDFFDFVDEISIRPKQKKQSKVKVSSPKNGLFVLKPIAKENDELAPIRNLELV